MQKIYALQVAEKKEQHAAAVGLARYAVLQAGGREPVDFENNAHGKPYLSVPNDHLYVNWSHSGEYVLCAVSDREIGVDIQENQKEPKPSLVRRVLQPEEREHYERVPAEEQRMLFYRYWTIKESFLKATGTGFYAGLDGFLVQMEADGPVIRQNKAGKTYGCRILPFANTGYTAAICRDGSVENTEIEYLSWRGKQR